MSRKNLLLCFSSFHVSSDPNNQREEEYAICYEQLIRILPDNFEILFVDNTTNPTFPNNGIMSQRLYEIISSYPTVFYDRNIGQQNKGLGELDMLVQSQRAINFLDFDTVSYFTGRRLVTCPYVFERTISLTKDALISNPPLVNIATGDVYPKNDTLYNDMFFTMKSEVMLAYCKYVQNILNNGTTKGSEHILYDFINENKIEYEWLKYLGFIRNDWEIGGFQYNKQPNNMQFC